MIKLIAFDADDTLWDCQSHFVEVEQRYRQLLADYADEQTVSHELFKTETANMAELGYGCKAFTLSLVENAVKISQGRIPANLLLQIQDLGRSPCPIMIVFTKGEIDDQQHKLERSGLAPLFDDCVVVADKTKDEYIRLAQRYGVDISEMLSVGNSFKSDVEPVLQLGGYAVHIPFTHLWAHEHTEEYEHPRLKVISHFGEFLQVFRMF